MSARHVVVLVATVLAALLLSGCLRTEMAITVDGDGSGTAAVEVYFDEVELDAARITQDDLVKLVETATQSIDGVDVSAVGRQGSRGFRVAIPFDDYHQLTEALTTGEYGGMSTRLFQSFQVTEGDDGHWSMNATVDPAGFRATLSQIPAGLSGSALLDESSTEFVFSVTLPGKVFRSNATSVDGATARWEFQGDTEAVNFTMDSEPAGFTTLQMVMAAVGALLVVGFILVLVTAAGSRRRWSGRRRRRRRKGGGPDPAEQWQPKAPAPGTVGGRDESVLPVMSGAAAPEATVAPPVGPAPLGGAASVPPLPDVPTTPATPIGTAAAPPTPIGTAAAPPTAPPPALPVLPTPGAPVAVPAPPTPPAAAPVPDSFPAPAAPPADPLPPQVAAAPPAATMPSPPAQAPPAPPSPAPPLPAPPAPPAPPTFADAPPTPVAPPDQAAPDQSHWLAPNPHEDPEAHWLDHPPPEEAPADPDGWVPLPPRSSDVPRFEYPEVDEL